MKKIIFSFGLLCLNLFVVASDLNFVVIDESGSGNNGSVDLTVTGGVGPYTYDWAGPLGFTAITEDISGLKTGTYTVTVTDKYCGIATYMVFVDIASDVKDISGDISLSVYPNPGNDLITMNVGGNLNNAGFKLVNIAGVTVLEKNNLNGNRFIFDLSEQASGIYFIEINNDGKFSRIRFMKN